MRVLFVCLGNICRSPSAHAVLRAKTQHLGWTVDSAGTGGWHVGDPPDPRAVTEAEARGSPSDGRPARAAIQPNRLSGGGSGGGGRRPADFDISST